MISDIEMLTNLKCGDIVRYDWDKEGIKAVEIMDATHSKIGLYFGRHTDKNHRFNQSENIGISDHVRVDTKHGIWVKVYKDKPEHMKQNGPKDQLTCIIMALEGGLDNLKEGIPTNLDNLLSMMDDLRCIQKYLPNKWD